MKSTTARRVLLAATLGSVGCATRIPRGPNADLYELAGAHQASGTAFAHPYVSGEALRKLRIINEVDNQAITSEVDGDGPTGTLSLKPFVIDHDYLTFRIGGGDYEYATCLNLVIDGRIVRSATGRQSSTLMAQSFDLRPYRGKIATLELVDSASGDWGHINVSGIRQTDIPEVYPPADGPLYAEALRPQFHFTARQFAMDRLEPREKQEGWINDLNGLIYFDGEYHLFAQRWARCWLHAVSRDLVHWTELAPAFWEESTDSGVQSGTIVVDYANTSGLSPDPHNPAMVAFWSRFDNRTFCASYSLDHGRTWKHYEKNPLFVAPERDPKVFWYAPAHRWVMVYYGDDAYHIRTSPDLLRWTDTGHSIPHSFECPDFFELPIDGDATRKKWVLIQGNGNYSYGTFDGTEFKEESGRRPCDVGPNFYATQSWANTETGDGRRIQAAWMREPKFPGMPFNQQVSFPCELTLRTTPDGLRIYRQPINELALLHASPKIWAETAVVSGTTITLAASGDLFDIQADVEIPQGSKLIFALRGETVTLTSRAVESGHAPAAVQGTVRHVQILLDRGSIETYLNHGEVSSTRFALPEGTGISMRAEGGDVRIRSLALYPLNSSWTPAH